MPKKKVVEKTIPCPYCCQQTRFNAELLNKGGIIKCQNKKCLMSFRLKGRLSKG